MRIQLAGLVEEGRAYIKKNGPASVDKDRRKLKAGEGQKKVSLLGNFRFVRPC